MVKESMLIDLLRRIIMKVLTIALIIVALLSLGMLAGCQEGYAGPNNSTKLTKAAFEPTGTGFWQPKLTYDD
jgi:hypothetical protein